MYAATYAELDGISGAYLQDCRIRKASQKGQDAELAGKLWSVTERQLSLVKNMQRGQMLDANLGHPRQFVYLNMCITW